jgi:cysteine desulfuration protein SufE
MTIDDLIAEFDDLGDWESRCDYLIDMGYDLAEMPEDLKTEENRVHGCQSNVWMDAKFSDDESRTIELVADSDAMIVKGLLAVVVLTYNGRTAQEILDTNIENIFARLGLNRHLGMARRNGLAGMVKRVRALAANALAR